MLPTMGNRLQLIDRYDKFVKCTLAEEGVSSPSEEESDEEHAGNNPAFIMVDEDAGNRYMRIVDQKGIGNKKEMEWVVDTQVDPATG